MGRGRGLRARPPGAAHGPWHGRGGRARRARGQGRGVSGEHGGGMACAGAGLRRGVRWVQCGVVGWVMGRRERGILSRGEPCHDAWRGWVTRRDGWRGTPLQHH